MEHFKLEVSPEDAGKRLDVYLFDSFKEDKKGISRTCIQKLIAERLVTVNEQSAAKPHLKVKTGDIVSVGYEEPKPSELNAEDIPLPIVYEDDDLIVLNKPQGLVVHPAPGNQSHTLVNALLFRDTPLSSVNPQRPGIVHRLDKETSGILVIAKNNFTHLGLAKQFADHSIKRRYVALVKGKMEFDENVIEAPIGRHPVKRKNMAVSFRENTKYAKTLYRTLKRSDECSLLELEPYTGRTHQLRVHLSFVKHPIMGDAKYGKHNPFPRMALHARYLGFTHPRTGKFMEFSTDIPEEFRKAVDYRGSL